VVARLIRLIKSQLSRYDCARRLDYLSDAVASTFLGNNSRFGELNSRLGRANSRFVALREFAGKGLICLTVFAVKRRLRAEMDKIPGFRGKNRELTGTRTRLLIPPL
jgi:hypothetical protein